MRRATDVRKRTSIDHGGQMVATTIFGALIDLSGPQYGVHWGRLSISLANLAVIGVMIAVFVLAIFVPYPRRARRHGS